ncbi:MAG: tetratricopeptide repeat protein, partial [Cyanobacteria bacterium]|nr:tetratricopeptide repeat protein [Cyanobacteriota bacterium]
DKTLDKAVEAYNKKLYPQALVLVNEVLKTSPDNFTAYYYKGLILNEQKQVDGAIVSYRKAIQYKQDFGDAYYALGLLLDTKKDVKGAKEAFQKFVDLSAGTDDDFVKYAKSRIQSL